MIFFELFYTFFLIGLFTFGGGYAMIPMITNEALSNGWMSNDTLTNYIAISEATPGPFAINIATAIGNTTAGPLGAVCATIGVVLPSFIIILLIAWIFNKILNNRFVKAGLKGVQPTVLSLILSTAIIFLVKAILFNGNSISTNPNDIYFNNCSFALLLILFGFNYIYKFVKKKNLSPLLILLLAAVLGILIF